MEDARMQGHETDLPDPLVSSGIESLESRASGKPLQLLWRILRKIPEVRRTRRAARPLAASLPDYEGDVALPDAETIYGWVEALCAGPHRRPGTAAGNRAETWVAERLREFGLDHVTLDPIAMTVWDAKQWSLTVNGEEIPSFFVLNTDSTCAAGVTAQLAYVGTGHPRDFARTDVAGKIVVADVPFPALPTGVVMKALGLCYALSDPERRLGLGAWQYLNYVRQNFIGGTTEDKAPEDDVYWQARRRGAQGICLILRDQPSNSNSHYGPYDGIMKPLPGLWFGKQDGARLRELARSGATATLVLDADKSAGMMHNVWGVLPGRSKDVILVTSHHDSPFKGAVEDGTGVAQVLAQAWAWSRVPAEARAKTMVFVVDSGHFYGSAGAHFFARQHKDILERTRILITLEHLAAKEVRERAGEYEETGRLAITVMFTTPEPEVVATVLKALERKPAPLTAPIPADLFGPAPTSDANGYVLEAGVPVISWIGCPYYLLDEHDTLDKVEKSALQPICETVTELVKNHMALP
jgi:hypothetical protein